MGWLDHKQLIILKGFGKLQTDSNSAENNPVVFNLMSDSVSLSPNGWTPQIASVKNGGVWVDSPITNGRELLAAPVGNVTEKIEVIINDNSYLGTMKQLDSLNRMAQDCRDYWQGGAQVDPVYLLWYAGCGAGQQFALLYDIEVAPDFQDASSPTVRVTITLEREPYWSAIPPGANPKQWTSYVTDTPLTLANATLDVAVALAGNYNLLQATLANRFEWSPASAGQQSAIISQNYITIPANYVPGDAPALISIGLVASPAAGSISNDAINNVYISKITNDLSSINHLGAIKNAALNLNVGDGNTIGVCTKTIGTTADGVKSNNSSVTSYFGRRNSTGVDANWVTFAQWGGSPGANGITLDRNLMRGNYAIFARMRNSSASPVLTDMRVRIFVEEFEDNTPQYISSQILQEVNPPLVVTTAYELSYMGTISIPFSGKPLIATGGYGTRITEGTNSNLRISVQQKVDVATANRILDVCDLIFVPVDEGLLQIAPPSAINSAFAASSYLVYDNTGYLAHGRREGIVVSHLQNGDNNGTVRELRGNDIYLTPHVDQRIYFLVDENNAGFILAYNNVPIYVGVNIVPRWSSIRDV